MKDRKWDFIPFSFYDRTGMERHLEKRAAQGWLLERIGSFGWYYRRIRPSQLHFTVTWYLRASTFDPEPTDGERTFQDFCAGTGWKLAASSGQMQVFYSEASDPVPIHTEPVLELAQVGRIARRSLPVDGILLAVGLWMICSWFWSLTHRPIDLLSSANHLATGAIWLMLTLWCAADLFCYIVWRRKAKKAAPLGEFVPTKGCHKLMLAALAVTGLAFCYMLLADRKPGFQLLVLLILAGYGLLFLAVNGVKNLLKRRKTSRALNRGITLAVDGVLAFALMGGITGGLLWGLHTGRISSAEELTDPPLSVEDLTGEKDERYITQRQTDATFLITRRNFYQHINWDEMQAGARIPSLDYTIVDIHLPFLYDWCMEELLHERDDWRGDDTEEPYYQYKAIDPAPWGAEQAYQLWVGGERSTHTYLLCWPERIVELDPSFELTQEQMTLAGDKLAPDSAKVPQNTPAELSVVPATEELLAQYPDHEEIEAAIDAYGNRLLLTTDMTVQDFSLFQLVWDEESQALVATEGDALYYAENFRPDCPLAVSVSFPGVFPTVGLSYTDTDGTQRVLHIGMSGKDGSFFLAEP